MDEPVEVRVLRHDEARILRGIAPDVFDHPIDERWTREFFADERHHLAVAIDRRRVIGIASGVHYVHPDKRPELWINEVGVAASYRRLGIGTRLLRALCEHARTLGCSEAWVLTEQDNVAARRLYVSAGGKERLAVYVEIRLEDAHRPNNGTSST